MHDQVLPDDLSNALAKAHGHRGQIWQFSVSLKRLVIRLYAPRAETSLYLICVSCEHMTGPFSWSDCDVVVVENNPGVVVRDRGAGFELHCGGVWMRRATMDFTLDQLDAAPRV